MTEAEWLKCADPRPMLTFLRHKASDRKLRLYLCGGCRHIANLYYRPESLTAVEVAERFADGLADGEELRRAEWDAEVPTFGYDFREEHRNFYPGQKGKVIQTRLVELGALGDAALSGGEWRVNEEIERRLYAAAELAEYCAYGSQRESGRIFEHMTQVDWPGRWLFDCVFANPFRPPALLPAEVLGWNDGTVRRIAEGIYAERAFDRLPILADALLDAGCNNEELLAHCRGQGPHVRGCGALDHILGKS